MHGHVSVFTAYDVDLNKVVNLKGAKKLKKKKKKKRRKNKKKKKKKGLCFLFHWTHRFFTNNEKLFYTSN
jgi:hypothetical protein